MACVPHSPRSSPLPPSRRRRPRAVPFANSFVRHDHATDEQPFFHVAVAEKEAEIQLDYVAADFSWEPMMLVRIG
jgi:hypothetical protein